MARSPLPGPKGVEHTTVQQGRRPPRRQENEEPTSRTPILRGRTLHCKKQAAKGPPVEATLHKVTSRLGLVKRRVKASGTRERAGSKSFSPGANAAGLSLFRSITGTLTRAARPG